MTLIGAVAERTLQLARFRVFASVKVVSFPWIRWSWRKQDEGEVSQRKRDNRDQTPLTGRGQRRTRDNLKSCFRLISATLILAPVLQFFIFALRFFAVPLILRIVIYTPWKQLSFLVSFTRFSKPRIKFSDETTLGLCLAIFRLISRRDSWPSVGLLRSYGVLTLY